MNNLLENLSYDPATGIFEWRKIPMGQQKKRAGYVDLAGYRHIRINRRLYKAHRLAWLAVHGEMPPQEIDHINGNPSDNRIINLRLATSAQNKWNMRRRCSNRSGIKGVSFNTNRRKWVAVISVRKKYVHLGMFNKREDAARAYADAAKRYYGEFHNLGDQQ